MTVKTYELEGKDSRREECGTDGDGERILKRKEEKVFETRE